MQEAECHPVQGVSLRADQVNAGDEQMDAENELSPAMKIFAWRGPSRGDMPAIAPRAGFDSVIASGVQPAAASFATIEIVVNGAVVRIMPGMDEGLLTRVLRAVRGPSDTP
jgi:hypothetical protein